MKKPKAHKQARAKAIQARTSAERQLYELVEEAAKTGEANMDTVNIIRKLLPPIDVLTYGFRPERKPITIDKPLQITIDPNLKEGVYHSVLEQGNKAQLKTSRVILLKTLQAVLASKHLQEKEAISDQAQLEAELAQLEAQSFADEACF